MGSHRLTASIIFGSSMLLTGSSVVACGGATDEGADAADAGPDARACEPGWPTTKGLICKLEKGLKCCEHAGGSVPECCVPPP
ncbi:MAG: hypothetical protein HOO96_06780 [Polyangiaceae bacterium]|nr:hypothetical protein [Polyangiaceae bacterium]